VADALVKKSPAIGQINLIRNSNGAENNLQTKLDGECN
jgi:hypothetical protein